MPKEVHYRGSPLGIRITAFVYRRFGYGAVRWIIALVALFYAAVSAKKRLELAGFYRAVGLRSGFLTYLRHIDTFAQTIFERFSAAEGMQEKTVSVERVNTDKFASLVEEGGIVLLSHHGNWAQSFKIFQTFDVTLHIVMAEAMDSGLQELEKLSEANRRIRIINMHEGMGAVVAIANALREKGIVIMMADRILHEDKTVCVDFLGHPTRFNSGPFEVARINRSLVIGLDIVRLEHNRIKLVFSDILNPGSSDRSAYVSDVAQQYAHFLEHAVKAYPLQWYNFYDFWEVVCTEGSEARR